MQSVNSTLQAELDKGQFEPRVLLDVYEFYDHDAVPGATGFDPADAAERFAAEEITWNGLAYRREIQGGGRGRSDITKNKGERLNSVTINFSNISRYTATWAQTTEIEGMIVVIRCISPSTTSDSIVLFTGKAGKPSDIDKESFTLNCEQYFGDINVIVPPRRFENSDPDGRLPSDPLYEGIDLVAIAGSVTFPQIVPTDSRIGRLFGRRRVTYRTEQWSSVDATPFGQVIPEIFGRCQMKLIPFAWADKGSHVGYLMAVGNGPLDAVIQLRSRTQGMSDPICSFANPPAPGVVHLGDPGGTGTNNGNTCQADLAGGRFFSNLAYIEGASAGVDANGNIVALGLDVADEVPDITALVRGKRVPLPNTSGVYGATGWTDNPVHIMRFALTDSKWLNINPAFMEDAVNYRTSLHCDEPIVDNSGSQIIVIAGPDITLAGGVLTRFQPTGVIRPRLILYDRFGDGSLIPQFEDGPYIGIDTGDPAPDPSDPSDPSHPAQPPLIKRYTANFSLTEDMKGTDFLHKILLPVFKGYIRTNKNGKLEVLSEQPSDATYLRTSTTVGATSIPVLNIEPWKTGLDLLKGMVRLGALGSTNSEARKPSAAVYSTSGNSVTLTVAKTGGVTISASGATLSGGSTTIQASGTITIGGTPAAGNSVTATIGGIAVTYILNVDDTTGTAAAMLHYYINAHQRLNKFISAVWDSASPTLITIICLHGALTVPAMLKAHTQGIADPTTAPAVAASSGGSLPAGTYLVAYANTTAIGATYLTPSASITVTANQKIDISALPALVGIGRDFYMSEKAGSENLRFVASRTDASDFSISAVPENGAALPPSHNTTAEELLRVAMSFATNSQDVFPVWTPSTVVILNDIYLPTSANGHKYQVTTPGTTGATEPVWPTGAGATVASGSVVFTEIGSTVLQQAGLTRANVRKATFKWPLGSKQSSVNQIKGNYRSAKDDFALTPFIVNDRAHQEQVKKKYPLEVDLPAVDNFNQMSRLANFHLSLNREGDWFNSLGTGPQGLVLEEGDLICSSDDSGGLVNVVTRIEELRIKPNHDVDVTLARKYSTLMFSDDVGSHRISLPSTLKFIATKDSLVEFIDLPAIRDNDTLVPGFYLSVTHDLGVQGDWRGWALWADFGDGYSFITKGDVPANMGACTTTLGTVSDIEPLDIVNEVTFTLDFVDSFPGFTSATEADLIANPYRNLFLIGDEYVQAATIVDNGGRSYTISDLFRGRFGTDSDELTHAAVERVVFINGAEKFIPMDISRLNIPFNYKVVTTNQDLADVTPVSFTWTGRSLVPRKVMGIVVQRDNADAALTANQFQVVIPTREHAIGEQVKYWVDIFSATDGLAFTVDASTNVFTSTSHNLVDGENLALSTTGVLPAPLHKINHYYARDTTTHTFKLAASPNGPAVDIFNTGSGTHKFTRRVRHMPVVNFGAFNPAVITIYTPTTSTWNHDTVTGSGGWDSTVTTEWTFRNMVLGTGPGAAGGGISAAALALITAPGAEVEFTLGSVAYAPGLQTSAYLNDPDFDTDGNFLSYREMRFSLFTDGDLPPESKAGSRRWKLTIHERATAAGSLDLVYTDPDLELPGMKYRMQLSGTELRYYRDYGGPNSKLLYRSTVPLILPLRPRFDVATEHRLENIKVGGLLECVTTYPDTDMIADFGTQPDTVRLRVYEERVVSGVSFFGDATDFIT